MRQFGVTRAQAMRLAGADFARAVPASAARAVLEAAAPSGLPVMVFVGNRGCLQIHAGPVHASSRSARGSTCSTRASTCTCARTGSPAAWVVRKPSAHGDIHSLELYDAGGELAAQVFGHRPARGEERADWRALVTGLPDR